MKKLDIPFGRPWIANEDRKAVMDVLKGHILTHGPNCTAFEDEFVAMMGGGSAASTSSCMAALHLSYLHFELGPGDEVIVPAMTHVATVHAVALTGATPVFVDCELQSGNMDLNRIEDAVTPRTRALSVVHFCGIPCAMPDVMRIADRYGLRVIEDCALAVGARYDDRHVGLFGHTGCYSFYPVKHITTGEGGMLVSQYEDVVGAISRFRAFNVDRSHTERTIPGIYDVTGVGMNYRMSEMQAALGRTQIKKIPEIAKRRSKNFRALKEGMLAIEGVSVLDAADDRALNSHYCLIAVLSGDLARRRDDMVRALNERGVGTSIYYPHPVPRLSHYRTKYGYDSALYPSAETISDRSIALPVGPHLTTRDMADMAKAFSAAVSGKTRKPAQKAPGKKPRARKK
ncbi:MAG: DegT/DnrJ/EryC1/StrS family aminotransferase [Proteobacteria bacterium]|nr:DegT/DnrJ/EryC1/StrS family aminotransferase [Pseudomonadota bacterium]